MSVISIAGVIDPTGMCKDGEEHRLLVVRMRAKGAKVRRQCMKCLGIGPWEKSSEHYAKGVEVKPDNRTPIYDAVKSEQSMTVAELRKRAKARGLTGYSKMNKADLIAALKN